CSKIHFCITVMVIKDAQINPNDYYLKCRIFVVFLLFQNEKLTQTSHLQVVWGNFSKTACRWFLLEMLSKAVDIIEYYNKSRTVA
ncbi:MAG: hypothetical protein IJZ61_08000, partial [Oscillospiraceae bacterium]|nr:hypothetical protein [Oscillospiraceae bacterium]